MWVRRKGGTRILRDGRSSSSSLFAGLGVVSCNALVLVSGYGPGTSLFWKRDPDATTATRLDIGELKLALAHMVRRVPNTRRCLYCN